MGKGKKFLLILGSVILLSLFLALAVIYHSIVELPFQVQPFRQFILTNEYARYYLLGASAILAVICLILIVVIIFYPKTQDHFLLKDNKGKLLIDKRAIEGLVRSSIKQEDFLTLPKVTVKAVRKKILVNVKGSLKNTSSVIAKTERWSTQVADEINRVLGTEQNIIVDVTFSILEDEQKAAKVAQPKARVE